MTLRAIATQPTSPGDLTRRLSLHPTATSRTITNLVRAGLVQRTADPGDARRFMLQLTEEGRRVTALIAQRIRPQLQQRLDRITHEERDVLFSAMKALLGFPAR